MTEDYFVVYMCHIFFFHLSADSHLDCFHILAFVTNIAVNPGVHVSFGIMVYSGYVPNSVVAGLFGTPVLIF